MDSPNQDQMIPSRKVIVTAEQTNAQNGHDNLGYLSIHRGLIPQFDPPLQLSPDYAMWDEVATDALKGFYELSLRKTLDAMPLLSADKLEDKYLQRATLVLSVLHHLYYFMIDAPPASVPLSITQPLDQISRRLKRQGAFLSYNDHFLYNWKWRDPAIQQFELEHLELLVPFFDIDAEINFVLPQVEITARAIPLIGSLVKAQEAVYHHDDKALINELIIIADCLNYVTRHCLTKIDPNPYSKTHVDMMIWAKTIALVGLPPNRKVPAASGSGAPLFQMLDAFLTRHDYKTRLGRDSLWHRKWLPYFQQEFIYALEKISIPSYVEESSSRALKEAYYDVIECYLGRKGFLNMHRMKVYGFLEISYKIGRPTTTGGFTGSFYDRTWEKVGHELKAATKERYHHLKVNCPIARIVQGTVTSPHTNDKVKHILLDIEGVRYRPGDRLGVFPYHAKALVTKTLDALKATGEEEVELTTTWREFIQINQQRHPTKLKLAEFLRYATLRPLTQQIGKALYQITQSHALREILDKRQEDQLEFWEALTLVADVNYDVTRLWKSKAWQTENICRVITPGESRMYSISSPFKQDQLDLTVLSLEYESSSTDFTKPGLQYGVASNFLTDDDNISVEMPCEIAHTSRFYLPNSNDIPIVMFAAGAGISPFRSFWQTREKQKRAEADWLFFGTRKKENLYYEHELLELVKSKKINLKVAFSEEDVELDLGSLDDDSQGFGILPGKRKRIDAFFEEPDIRSALWDLIRRKEEGGKGAYFYICGQHMFASAVLKGLKKLVASYGESQTKIYQLIGDGRYMQDIFTTFAPIIKKGDLGFEVYSASEIMLHNNTENGYWFIINGLVYNITEFLSMHNGGNRILEANAGIDATSAYQIVDHNLNSEINAMIDMYKIGIQRRLHFRDQWGIVLTASGIRYLSLEDYYKEWVTFTYLIVEIENALRLDFDVLNVKLQKDDVVDKLTPYKIELLLTTHERFIHQYLNNTLFKKLYLLWGETVGLLAPEYTAHFLQDTIEGLLKSPEAKYAHHLSDNLRKKMHEESVSDLIISMKNEDCIFMHKFKMLLREGLLIFEEFEGDTVKNSKHKLIDILLRVPDILYEYFHELSNRV